MHCKDCKGVIASVAGSVLVMLVQDERRLGRNQDLRLEALNADLKAFQSGEQCQHPMPPTFKQDLFKDEWANLNSRLVKAANSRALVPWLYSLVSRFFDSGGTTSF